MNPVIPFITCENDSSSSDGNGKITFKISDEATQILSTLEGPLAIITIAGLYRTGKSYVMNRLAGSNKGFNVGSTVEPCTQGIYIWVVEKEKVSTTLGIQDKNIKNVILMDTEGIGSYKKSKTYDVQIFALAILLSSYFIYNSLGTIDETALDRLALVTEVSSFIRISDSPDSQNSNLNAHVPKFMWLLRDFVLKLESEGRPISATQYLENVLKPLNGDPDRVKSRNIVRQSIVNLFSNRVCFTMKRPVNDEKLLQRLENIREDEIRPEFLDQANELIKLVFKELEPKRMYGECLDGKLFLSLALQYVKAINNGGVPTIQSSWDNVAQMQTEASEAQAWGSYESRWRNFESNNPSSAMDEEEIRKLHVMFSKEAICLFVGGARGSKIREIQDKLERRLEQALETRLKKNAEASRINASDRMEEISHIIEDEINQDIIKDINDLEPKWNQLLQEKFDAKGPRRSEVLVEYLRKKPFQNANRILRKTLQDYDVKTEKKIREIKQDAQTDHQKLETLYTEVKSSWLQAKEEVRKLESENTKLIGVVANLSNAIMDLAFP